MVNPKVIERELKIEILKIVQKKGDFVITWPKAYHAGFNRGFNISEAINFALFEWWRIARVANLCKCDEYTPFTFDLDHLLELVKSCFCKERIVFAYFK